MTWRDYIVRLTNGTTRYVRALSVADALWRASNRNGIAPSRIAGIDGPHGYEPRESILERTKGRP